MHQYPMLYQRVRVYPLLPHLYYNDAHSLNPWQPSSLPGAQDSCAFCLCLSCVAAYLSSPSLHTLLKIKSPEPGFFSQTKSRTNRPHIVWSSSRLKPLPQQPANVLIKKAHNPLKQGLIDWRLAIRSQAPGGSAPRPPPWFLLLRGALAGPPGSP